jgi:hypothetical protein
MRKPRLKKFWWRSLAGFAVVGAARAALAQSIGLDPGASYMVNAPMSDDGAMHFRIGGMVALNLKANFSLGGSFNIAGNNVGPLGVTGKDHVFDDGYVRVDQTGDALGQTSYWGYNSATQIGPGNTLLMHSASSYALNSQAGEDAGPLPGFDMAYGANFWNTGWAQVGWELGAGLLPIRISNQQNLSTLVSESTYSFNTGGIILPTAPYHGGPSGLGPTISDVATAVGAPATVPGTVASSQMLDLMLYNLRLGPTLNFKLGSSLGLELGVGPAVGLVSGDLKFNDAITTPNGTAYNSGKVSQTDFVYGGYANATILYHIVPGGDIYAGAQYMPLSNANINGAGRAAELKLGGQIYFTLGINWPF